MRFGLMASTAALLLAGCGPANDAPPPNDGVTANRSDAVPSAPTPAPAVEAAPAQSADAWLIGGWLPMEDPNSRDMIGCEGDTGITYRADHRYVTMGESGTWKIAGDSLIQTPTEIYDGDARRLNTPVTSGLKRIGADEIQLAWPDGGGVTLRRCPAIP